MKFLKTIRFDNSDSQVFENAADGGEWAIPGGFLFANARQENLKGKPKQAFSNGFFSLESFGHSTFVSVEDISANDLDLRVHALADFFINKFGAPDKQSAVDAARQETQFVSDLCGDVPINSLFAMRRYFNDEGEIREEFTIVDAPGAAPNKRVWGMVET